MNKKLNKNQLYFKGLEEVIEKCICKNIEKSDAFIKSEVDKEVKEYQNNQKHIKGLNSTHLDWEIVAYIVGVKLSSFITANSKTELVNIMAYRIYNMYLYGEPIITGADLILTKHHSLWIKDTRIKVLR